MSVLLHILIMMLPEFTELFVGNVCLMQCRDYVLIIRSFNPQY